MYPLFQFFKAFLGNLIAERWSPMGVSIDSWAIFIGYTVFILLVTLLIAFSFWRSRSGFVEHKRIMQKEDLLSLRKNWINIIIMIFFVSLIFHLIGVIFMVKPLVTTVILYVFQLLIIEFAAGALIFWLLTIFFGPPPYKYVPPGSVRLKAGSRNRRL